MLAAGAAAIAAAAPRVSHAQSTAPIAGLLSGQQLIYSGRYSAAALYFTNLETEWPLDPAAPALHASALIWWGEARLEPAFQDDSIDALLVRAVDRATAASSAATTDSARVAALFWLGTARGYRARQAEMHGNYWRAAREARAMQQVLGQALAVDSSCVDCQLPLGVYDYGLARVGSMARLVGRILGLSGGDAVRGMERLRRAGEAGVLTRTEARWVYANALARESGEDASRREEAIRIASELVAQFPENTVFRRLLTPATGAP